MKSVFTRIPFVINCVFAYTNSLSDCETVAALFHSTCDAVVATADWSSSTGDDITCVGANMCVSDDTYSTSTSYSCTHTTKFCVTCTETSAVYIRV